jgi:hypothetical protein
MKQPRKMKKRSQRSNFVRYVNNVQLLYSDLKTDSGSRLAQLQDYVRIIVNHKVAAESYWIESTVSNLQFNNCQVSHFHFCIDDPERLLNKRLIKQLKYVRNAYSRDLLKEIAVNSSLLALEELNDPPAKISAAAAEGSLPGGTSVVTTINPTLDAPLVPNWFSTDRPFWRREQEIERDFFVNPSRAVMLSKGANLTSLSVEATAALLQRATAIAEQALETFIRSLKEDDLPGSRIDRRELIRTKARSMHIHTNDGKEEDNAILFNQTEANLYYLTKNPSIAWTNKKNNCYVAYAMALAS